MSDEKMREGFEDWYAQSWSDEDPRFETAFAVDDRGQYQWSYVNDAWVVWNASRAAVVVELPRVCQSDDPFELKRDIIDELEALGLKVKP